VGHVARTGKIRNAYDVLIGGKPEGKKNRDSSVGIALGYGLEDSRWGVEIFLFTTASGTALGPTQSQSPIQRVPGALPWG